MSTSLLYHGFGIVGYSYVRTEGYDPITQLYLDFGGKKFPALEVGGQEHAEALVNNIVSMIFSDFDWEDDRIDKIGAITILLTTLLRKT